MTAPKRRPFNVDEYYRLLDVGILQEDTRIELIEGDIIEQVFPTRLQSSCTMRLHALFAALKLYDTAIISVKHPVRLSEYTEPIPELTLLRRQDDFYESGHPTPADVLLLVEIAEIEVEYDRVVKLPLYAKAGIQHLWLVNVQDALITICSHPTDKAYEEVRTVKRRDSFTSPLIPNQILTGKMIMG